jgi:tetratricopeptide (TPR) repeat protein
MTVRHRRPVLAAILCAALGAACIDAAPLPGLSGTGTPGASSDSPEARGLSLLAANDLAGAERAFQDALARQPAAAGPMLGLAEVALRRKKPQEAREWAEKALRAAPDTSVVQSTVGRLYAITGDPKRAEAAYHQALKLDARNDQAQIGLGELYLGVLQRPKDALAAFRVAASLRPDLVTAQLGVGLAHAQLKQVDAAAQAFRAAASLAPANPTPLHALGRLYAGNNRPRDALAAFDGALKADPAFLPALADRADILAQLGRDGEAVPAYQALVKANPADAAAQLKIGVVYKRLGRAADERSTFLVALKRDPNLPLAYNNLAWMEMQSKGDLRQALAWAQKAVELKPDVPHFQDTLGWVYRARGERDKALPALEKAASLPPPQAVVSYHLGVLYAEHGRSKDALAALRRALQIDRNFADAADARTRIEALSR